MIRGYAHIGNLAIMRLSGELNEWNEPRFIASITDDLDHGCIRFLVCVGKDCLVTDHGCRAFTRAYSLIQTYSGELVVVDLNNQCRERKDKFGFKILGSIKEGFKFYKEDPREI